MAVFRCLWTRKGNPNGERGQTMVVTAAGIVVLCLFAALVADVGLIYLRRAQAASAGESIPKAPSFSKMLDIPQYDIAMAIAMVIPKNAPFFPIEKEKGMPSSAITKQLSGKEIFL